MRELLSSNTLEVFVIITVFVNLNYVDNKPYLKSQTGVLIFANKVSVY